MDLTQAVLTVVDVAKRAKLNFSDNSHLRGALYVIETQMFPAPQQPIEPAVDDSIVSSEDTLSEIKEGE